MSTDQKVIIMHGFEYAEIDRIMRAVKGEFPPPRDIIFAKTTENSVKMVVSDLIADLSEDHAYLKENPPEFVKKQRESAGGAQQQPHGGGANE